MEATELHNQPTRATDNLSLSDVEQAIIEGGSLRQAAKILKVARISLMTMLAEHGKRAVSATQIDLLPIATDASGKPDMESVSPEARIVLSEPIKMITFADKEEKADYWSSEAERTRPDPGRGQPFGIEQLRFIRRAGYHGMGVRAIAPHWGINQPRATERLKRHGLHTVRSHRAQIVDLRKPA